MDKTSGIEMSAVGPGPPSYSVAMELDPPAYSTITQQPGVLGSNFGPPGVTVRTLTDTPQDAEFAARLMVVAFKPKLTHAVGERK